MKTIKPIYYSTMFGRQNFVRKKVLMIFLELAGFFRLIPEVFIRKRMGERYFVVSSAITVAIALAFAPIRLSLAGSANWDYIIKTNIPYYVFLAAFVFQCVKRYLEIRREPSVFDFARYSLSSGDIHPFFLTYKGIDGKANIRAIEIYLEPLAILIAGILLLLVNKPLGGLIIFCAIVYCLSYMAQYEAGDNAIMEIIDGQIVGEDTESIIMNGTEPAKSRGVKFRATRPTSQELRSRLWKALSDDDDDEDVSLAE